MKFLLLVIPVLLASCRTAPLPVPPPPSHAAPVAPIATAPPPPTSAPAHNALLELKLRQQAQTIEALISQNDALTAKLATMGTSTPQVIAPTVPVALNPSPPANKPATIVAPSTRAPDRAPASPQTLTVAPDADGVIDLTLTTAEKPGEPVNPFLVRTVPKEGMREITLHVGGVVAGPKVCAVVNDRLVQSGDMVDTMSVERIDSDAVILRREGQRMRIPVSPQPVRVRIPL